MNLENKKIGKLIFIFALFVFAFSFVPSANAVDDPGASSIEIIIRNCPGEWQTCATPCNNLMPDGPLTADQEAAGRQAVFGCQRSCDSVVASCKKQMSYSKDPLKTVTEQNEEEIALFGCKQSSLTNDGCCAGYKRTENAVCCPIGKKSVYNAVSKTLECVSANLGASLSRAEVTASKAILMADKKDYIDVTFKFIGLKDGKEVPFTESMVSLASSNVYFDTSAATGDIIGNTTFKFSPSVGNVDSSGIFRTRLSVESSDIRDSVKVKKIPLRIRYNEGYDSGNSKTFKNFTLDVPPISILSVKKQDPTEPVQQNSWGIFTVEVDDASAQNKKYTISSPIGSVRIEGKTKTNENSIETKDNSMQFSWQAPQISRELKMDIAAELSQMDNKALGKITEEIGKAQLDAVFQNAIPVIKDGFNIAYQGGFKGGLQVKATGDIVKSFGEHFPGAAEAYEEGRYQMLTLEGGVLLVDGFNYVDGAIGIVTGIKGGAGAFNPADVSAKVGLNWIRDYSEMVTRLDKAANSKEMTQMFPIRIEVGSGGTPVSRTISVPVVGETIIWSGNDTK